MKLKELLDEIFKDGPIPTNQFGMSDYALYGSEKLEPLKDKLLECDEFKNLYSLRFVDAPTFRAGDEVYVVETYKLTDDIKFIGSGVILSIALTPEMYDPNVLLKPVKDGAAISPTFYNPTNFEPYKRIVLEFSPERMQDGISNHEEIVRQELHDLLDKVLDNPKDYLVKGERAVLVRGIFQKESDNNQKPLLEYPLVAVEDQNASVFYLKKSEPDDLGNFSMRLEKKLIPVKLKDKFMEKFEDRAKNLTLTEEEIDKFLEENK
jgi:hypothetical protein